MKIHFCADDGELLETLDLTDGDKAVVHADIRNTALLEAYRSAQRIILARKERDDV